MTNIEFGALLFAICLLLNRFPDAGGDRDVRGRRVRFRLARGLGRIPQPAQHGTLRAGVELHAFRIAAVPPDGAVRDPGRAEPLAVRGGARLGRTPAGRARHFDYLRLRGVRCDLRLLHRDRGDDGLRSPARDEALRLFRGSRDWHACRRRHARHPDSALGHSGDLRDHHRAVGGQAVPGGPYPRHHRDRRLFGGNRLLRAVQPGSRSGGPCRAVARTGAEPRRGMAGGGDLPAGDRRHLSRGVHADRRRGDRRGGDRAGRHRIRAAELGELRFQPAGDGAGHRDDHHHPDQRRDL